MSKFNWQEITKEDILQAIEKFIEETPEYPEPRNTYLVYEGKKLPAKHIRGIAYEVHYGKAIRKSDFGGGKETAHFFERYGFIVDYKEKSEIKKVGKNINTAKQLQKKKKTDKKEITKEDDKIKIPSKQVIEQKNALQLLLNRMFNGDIVCEKTYSWMKTPEKIEGEYQALYDVLSSYRGDTKFAKRNVVLRCDFVCEGEKLIVEYDERQHFSEARKVSLESYLNVPLNYDRGKWIKACEDVGAKDNSPINRDEIRAYYDSIRDIQAYKHGYRLVRIMHGQTDFEAEDAEEELKRILDLYEIEEKDEIVEQNNDELKEQKVSRLNGEEKNDLKVGMYLQTNELKNKRSFEKMIGIIKQSDLDILVFPESCYVPFVSNLQNGDILSEKDCQTAFEECKKLSKDLGMAVVVSSEDKFGTLYSIFANAFANLDQGEEENVLYIKHTMTSYSAFEMENYSNIANQMFVPIIYKGYRIALSICYDCNHSLFSRVFGLQGIDLIINSTGGDVIYDKWYKYNKTRAIENSCYNLVTMGGNGALKNPHCYVYGFNANGGEMELYNLCGRSDISNDPGGIYKFEVTKESGKATKDTSLLQTETINKNVHLNIPVGTVNELIEQSKQIKKNIYMYKVGDKNVFFLLVDAFDIIKPEKVLLLLYDKELKKYNNRHYIIINKHQHIEQELFESKLSVLLKTRAMENFCAIILESDNINRCYQCGKNRTAQIVKAVNGFYGIDLDRTSGPEAIWKNKMGMKAAWRNNFEWLVDACVELSENLEIEQGK